MVSAAALRDESSILLTGPMETGFLMPMAFGSGGHLASPLLPQGGRLDRFRLVLLVIISLFFFLVANVVEECPKVHQATIDPDVNGAALVEGFTEVDADVGIEALGSEIISETNGVEVDGRKGGFYQCCPKSRCPGFLSLI